MSKRPFFLAAIMLAVTAFITHCVARDFLEQAVHRKAARLNQALKEQVPYVADPVAIQASHAWNTLTITGVVLTVLSVLCMAIANRRHEPGWYRILLLVLFCDIGMPMLL
jgi:multisubunit Na+/H+ antiporter MnhG subunit